MKQLATRKVETSSIFWPTTTKKRIERSVKRVTINVIYYKMKQILILWLISLLVAGDVCVDYDKIDIDDCEGKDPTSATKLNCTKYYYCEDWITW